MTSSLQLTLSAFQLIWNVPSQPCRDQFGITLDFSQYGISSNAKQTFMGEKVSLFYDIGMFPRFVDSLNGSQIAVNGGIPQLGDLELHLRKVTEDVQTSTDAGFVGFGIIDFESWRAILTQNFDMLQVYRNASEDLVRQSHPTWNKTEISNEASRQFDSAARLYFLQTLLTAQSVRPLGQWGFYHYPYCFTRPTDHPECSDTAVLGNNELSWLFNASQILLPSLYLKLSETTFIDRARLILSTIQETIRVNRRKIPVYPYMQLKYEDGDFLSKEDLINTLGLTFDYGGAGVFLWGSSSDVNSAEKCTALSVYLNNTLGPVSEYFHSRLIRCSEVFCGSSYRCQPRLRKRRKQPFISQLERVSALSYLIKANPALGRRLFRTEFRCIPW